MLKARLVFLLFLGNLITTYDLFLHILLLLFCFAAKKGVCGGADDSVLLGPGGLSVFLFGNEIG
jgi:hypothetical protein